VTKLELFKLAFFSLVCLLPLGAVAGESDKAKALPIRLEPAKIAYADMSTDFPPWPDEYIESGVSEHRYKTLYSGDINVEIYEAKPLVLRIDDYSIDEFVTVISGTLILTADGEPPQRFDAGDSVLVPKGFTGTWEMQGNFRELIVMLNESGGEQE
jgi:uncharacterized cupin superfamily protein